MCEATTERLANRDTLSAIPRPMVGGGQLVVAALLLGVGCSLLDDGHSSLMVHFPFDGNVVDVSGKGNHGVAHAVVPTEDRRGRAGMALYFGGDSSYVSVPYSNSLVFTGAMTLSLWAKGSACDACNASHVGLISKRSVDPFGLSVDDGDRVLFRVISERVWTQAEATGQPTDSTSWVHYAGVYEPTGFVRVYRNGELIAENAQEVPLFVDDSSRDLWIGTRGHSRTPDVPLFFFQGSIDEVRVYSRALDTAEIAELAQ